MSMNKNVDSAYLNQYMDNVIKRGYEIYDEWIDKKHDSRKIVASAERAVKLFIKRKAKLAFIDAFASLFALDTRIKQKYNTFLRCLFSYFSWRRETRALRFLKSLLNIPLDETDIRNAIAVEIERVAEKLENEWDEDGDDETHGGKRNGKSEEEVASEKKEAEAVAEENPEAEELADKEEKEKDSEQKEETLIEDEDIPQEEAREEISVEKEAAEPQQEEAEKTATNEKEGLAQETDRKHKEENNVSDVESETKTDKKEEARTYNDAVDSPPLYEQTARDRSSEQPSLTDELILDEILKGNRNITENQRVDEAARNKEADRPQDTVANQNEGNKSTDKNAYLYDKMMKGERGTTVQNAEKTAEEKTDSKQEPTQQTNEIKEPVKQESDDLRVPLQVDIDEGQENDMRIELSLDMTSEVVEAIKNAQSEFMSAQLEVMYAQEQAIREQLRIEELSAKSSGDIIDKQEPLQAKPPEVRLNRK